MIGPASVPVPPIARFVWDLTYACPLRCLHCFTESGRRDHATMSRTDALRVAGIIAAARPQRVSLGGGEPLVVPWWDEAAWLLTEAGIPVTVFTSGWIMSESLARRAADSVTAVAVSMDGASASVHDYIRGRVGSFDRAMAALEHLARVKRDRQAAGARTHRLGLEYTVTRSGWHEVEDFVSDMTERFPELDYINFGAVIPEGLAQEEAFVERELLSDDQLAQLSAAEPALAARARNAAEVKVVDARSFLPAGPYSGAGDGVAHIEADGQFRASTNFEAKVGNVLTEPLAELWSRALSWRADPFVAEQRNSIRNLDDWARVTRLLDRRYGSAADQERIARRPLVISARGSEPRASTG